MKWIISITVFATVLSTLLFGCSTKPKSKTTGAVQKIQTVIPKGRKLRVAITSFEDKTHVWTIDQLRGLEDMLISALSVNDKFEILEKQELSALDEELEISEGKLKKKWLAADVIITGALTGYHGATSGIGGGVYTPIPAFNVIADLAGGFKRSWITGDVRVIDVKTRRILGTGTSEVTSNRIGGGTGVIAALSGISLSGFENSPVEKMARVMITDMVDYLTKAL